MDAEQDALCPAPIIFSMIGGKWKLSILKTLIFKETKRFGELRREVEGITQTMLTKQLRELEADGLIHREVFAEVPPRVEYSATEDGLALKPVFEAMHQWWLERK
ncbi:winged helix-turn-helix transcriptional regulator [Cohaesibacter gelatinilyticus]|jgi:DNA-binding HxlR family transcriptional regulator|uniref:Transcriptional regulator, HxlR family n=1 Tax=Cohaesibacter gelatinilyticus TaxID=372072 RepID=A0A285PDN5_9HYPH|nr:helix-turn-helix domain-containing protein [Cohaesibacter gelatinilyticus]SNZ19855.1 transcriptional regulator, HxlR family [Cohaesibacter gelatinilyticus]